MRAKSFVLGLLFLFTCLISVVSDTTPAAHAAGGLPIPSLDDERNTYRSWGWTWTADKEPAAVTEPIANYYVSDPSIHDVTEGDDLWTYLMMYRRTGNSVYLNRANAWARYFKNDYRNCVGGPNDNFCYDQNVFNADHMYGWGLIAWYEYSGDTAALTEAENLGAIVEGIYSDPKYVPGQYDMAYWGLRWGGRHLLLVTRLAEVTQKQRWITLRDKLLDLWLQSAGWDSRGMYFVGVEQTDLYAIGPGAYAKGIRVQSPFQLGILVEAFAQAYRTTGRTELKNRIIAMAHFVDKYGLEPTYQYTSSWWGIWNGQGFFNYIYESNPPTFWDSVYTTDLVNTLVYGYKYSGDSTLLDRAKYFFNRGTKGIYGSPTQRTAGDTEVAHFVDTVFSSGDEYWFLAWNKGELQYTYLLFENGGSPPSETTPPSAPTGLQVK